MEFTLTSSCYRVALLIINNAVHIRSRLAAFIFKRGAAATSILNFKFGRACVVPTVAHFRDVIVLLAPIAL